MQELPERAVLLLPEIRPPPSPTGEELRLVTQLRGAFAEPRRRGSSPNGLGEGKRRRSALCNRGGLEDALFGSSPRTSIRGGPSRQRVAVRPTQRQPIDDETSVPADVFDRMLRLGSEARSRATHTVAFALPTGTPYLRRYDVGGDCQSRSNTNSPCPALILPSRRPSTCASEAMEERWRSSETTPAQVL
mmetsp:Transcript_58359/g.162664  ORF Transcript_58359/g.162664 Transcript_58359/m.162664 type:complete len:190 (-) Transcript_58359:202-771(-)